jgi:hypothetical protein
MPPGVSARPQLLFESGECLDRPHERGVTAWRWPEVCVPVFNVGLTASIFASKEDDRPEQTPDPVDNRRFICSEDLSNYGGELLVAGGEGQRRGSNTPEKRILGESRPDGNGQPEDLRGAELAARCRGPSEENGSQLGCGSDADGPATAHPPPSRVRIDDVHADDLLAARWCVGTYPERVLFADVPIGMRPLLDSRSSGAEPAFLLPMHAQQAPGATVLR